jgi:hypothetical protein
MNTQETIEQATLAKTIAEMHKLNEETSKYIQEAHKARNEGDLAAKKAKWFEFSLVLALIAATIAITKIFL